MRVLISPFPLTGLDEEGGADYLPGPMPENPVDARLAGLLVPAPHVVPEKKAKKEATGTRKSSRFQVSDDSGADSSPENEEEKEDSLPEEGERKRKASPTGEAEGSKRGRTIPPDSSANINVGEEEWPSRARPPARS